MKILGSKITVICVALILFLAISPLWSDPVAVDSVPLLVGYAALLLSFVLGTAYCHVRYEQFTNALISVVILAATCSAGLSMILFHSLEFSPLLDNRLFGIGRMENPVVSAISYSVPLSLSIVLIVTSESLRARFFWSVPCLILLTAVIMTGTRSIWVGLAIALAVLSMTTNYSAKTRSLMLFGFFGVVTSVFVIVAGSDLGDFLFKRAFSYRPEIWSQVLTAWRETNWLFGAGINTRLAITEGIYQFKHPHSVYLATLFYGGLIGLALLCTLLSTTGYKLRHAPATSLTRVAITSLTFGAVTMAFDGDRLLEKIDYLWIVLWLPVALSICATSNFKVAVAVASHE